jgi:hypothetical protein
VKKLSLPREWWTWPNIRHPSAEFRFAPQYMMSGSELQRGAHTGSINDFSPFTSLETLVMHSAAIIRKGSHDTEVADPTITLPASIRNITVYGAHDGLWSWVTDILEHRASQFFDLKSITLLRDDPIPGLKLSSLRELKTTHTALWNKPDTSSLTLRGHV